MWAILFGRERLVLCHQHRAKPRAHDRTSHNLAALAQDCYAQVYYAQLRMLFQDAQGYFLLALLLHFSGYREHSSR